MEGFADEGKAVGLILDVSLRHNDKGLRLFDLTKDSLIKFVLGGIEDGVDSFYLYHPLITEPSRHMGEMVADIGNYQTDGTHLNLNFALEQTLYVVAAEDDDLRKYVIFVTDRCQNSAALQKMMRLNAKDRVDAQFLLVGIGTEYSKSAFKEVKDSEPWDGAVEIFHLDEPAELTDAILKEKPDGPEDVRSQTDERPE